eukprot:SAG31_NODE_1399_length_8500_cov_22.401857_5_plen_138_part_00
MSTIDKDGDDAVSLEELIVGITTSSQLQQLGDIFIWRQHFEKFDIDSSGFIDSEEVWMTAAFLASLCSIDCVIWRVCATGFAFSAVASCRIIASRGGKPSATHRRWTVELAGVLKVLRLLSNVVVRIFCPSARNFVT